MASTAEQFPQAPPIRLELSESRTKEGLNPIPRKNKDSRMEPVSLAQRISSIVVTAMALALHSCESVSEPSPSLTYEALPGGGFNVHRQPDSEPDVVRLKAMEGPIETVNGAAGVVVGGPIKGLYSLFNGGRKWPH